MIDVTQATPLFAPGDVHRWECACGDYPDEAAGLADLDARISGTGLFQIMREVRGELIHVLPGTQDKTMRIDRILYPTPKLLEAGWLQGCVGIEAKKPGEKMGPALAQALDYMRTAFISPRTGARMMLNWVALWPFEWPSGPTESVLAQNRIATCTPRVRGFKLRAAGSTLLYQSPYDGKLTINAKDGLRKAGAR